MNLIQAGLKSLKSYVKTVGPLICANEFDLLVAGGDSGQIMARLTEIVYLQLGMKPPLKVVMPIYRHQDEQEIMPFDNSVLGDEFRQYMSGESLSRVLMVDDEVGSGMALQAMVELLTSVLWPKTVDITFVAEDGGMTYQPGSGVPFRFVASQKRADGTYNAISHIIPSEYKEPMKKALGERGEDLNDKQLMLLLLDLPIKEYNDGRPRFTFHYHEIVKGKVELDRLQGGFQKWLEHEIFQFLS